MPADPSDAIESLLVDAKQAHGVYEATELSGVYDQEWPRWYATYAVEHGLGRLLGREVDSEELGRFLEAGYAEFERADPKPAEPWESYLARRIASELGGSPSVSREPTDTR